MNTFKSTSRHRPSRATLYQRQLEERKDDEAFAWGALIWVHRDIAADIDLRYWAAGLDGAAAIFGEIAHAIDINARAAHLERTGAEDDTEGPMNPEHLEYGH